LNEKFVGINDYFANTNLLNPLTWGNLIGVAGSVVAIMASIPGIFVAFTSSAVTSMPFIPGWVVGFVSAFVLGIIVFAALKFLIGSGGET
jgi:hypothetical protein